jgi:hypothetical protein
MINLIRTPPLANLISSLTKRKAKPLKAVFGLSRRKSELNRNAALLGSVSGFAV